MRQICKRRSIERCFVRRGETHGAQLRSAVPFWLGGHAQFLLRSSSTLRHACTATSFPFPVPQPEYLVNSKSLDSFMLLTYSETKHPFPLFNVQLHRCVYASIFFSLLFLSCSKFTQKDQIRFCNPKFHFLGGYSPLRKEKRQRKNPS